MSIMVFYTTATAKRAAVLKGTIFNAKEYSYGNFSHKERDVSFSFYEKFGWRSMFPSEQPETFPC